MPVPLPVESAERGRRIMGADRRIVPGGVGAPNGPGGRIRTPRTTRPHGGGGTRGMARHRRWLRRLVGAVALAALAAAPGCLRFLHPVDPPTKEQIAPSAALPNCCRNHVHVFFIHGMDPL